jgi:hypothetical protein
MNPPASARSVEEQGAAQPRVVATAGGSRPSGQLSGPAEPGAPATNTGETDRNVRRDAPAPKARARHAHLFVTHFDPWSVMKNAFMMAIALAIALLVAVTVLWSLLALSGTLDAITGTITDIAGGGANTLDMANLFSFSRVIGITAVLAVLEVILVTALATLFAFLYNIAVGITGGLQVTLTDDS